MRISDWSSDVCSSDLFICGGAFAGIEKIIEGRMGANGVGFTSDIRKYDEKEEGELLTNVLPEDLLKFGLIPEFIGRLPVIGAVSPLDQEALRSEEHTSELQSLLRNSYAVFCLQK